MSFIIVLQAVIVVCFVVLFFCASRALRKLYFLVTREYASRSGRYRDISDMLHYVSISCSIGVICCVADAAAGEVTHPLIFIVSVVVGCLMVIITYFGGIIWSSRSRKAATSDREQVFRE